MTVKNTDDIKRGATKECENYSGKPLLGGWLLNDHERLALFRAALIDDDQDAWKRIYPLYYGLVSSWVRADELYPFVDEEPDYFVNWAFERLLYRIRQNPKKFEDPKEGLASILDYLKLCVYSAIRDYARAMLRKPTVPIDQIPEPSVPPDFDEMNAEAFWKIIDAQLKDDKEKIAIYKFFLWGYKDQEIYDCHPDIFRDAREVANKRGSVMKRLLRWLETRPDLRELLYALAIDTPGNIFLDY
ncbi:MAG: hypothetical protein AAF639_17220 [Chloroflexota bacterium]